MKEIKLNKEISFNLNTLIESRLLIQANSGGGKSWSVRRILEQSHGQVQQIVIDSEGEFASLREKYDYILAGKDGDTPAEPKSAALLARKLLELNVSAIIDIYELHPQERKHFVKLFLDALVNSPKNLWHPCIIVLDEAHNFAPEKGQSEAMDAVIGLASLGRKRQFCPIFATQRISKLHKDVAAECNNKLIGRTGLDIDMKRAADELGFSSKDQFYSLRNLEAGEFFVFGPAISREVIKVKIGEVSTTHRIVGSDFKVIPPTEKIKGILKKLGDIPTEAKKEALTISDLHQKIRNLEQEKRALERQPNVTDPKAIEKPVTEALTRQARDFEKERESWRRLLNHVDRCNFEASKLFAGSKRPDLYLANLGKTSSKVAVKSIVNPLSINPKPIVNKEEVVPMDDLSLGSGERLVLIAIAQQPDGMSREHITVQTGYKRSTRDAYIQRLQNKSFVRAALGKIHATDSGIEALGSNYEPLPQGRDLIEYHLRNLPEGEAKIFKLLVEAYENNVDKVMNREDITTVTGYQRSTRDAYIQRLTARQLVEAEARGMVKASDILFQ